MNKPTLSMKVKHALAACVLLVASAAVSAQTLLEIGTTAEGGQALSTQLNPSLLAGEFPAVIYGQGQVPGLTVRPERPILCARTVVPSGNPLKRVVLDPNGYFDPIPLAMSAVDLKDGPLNYMKNAFLRASDAMSFNSSAFVTVEQQLALDVDGVQAYCLLTPTTDTPPVASACNTTSETPEEVFQGGFEMLSQGTLQLTASSQLVPPLNTEVSYEYVLRAVGGPVFNVRLREQFPYYLVNNPSDTLVFKKSMQLEHNWSCKASSDGVCDARGRELDGAGYIHLDGGKLAEGACVKITTTRQFRTDGPEATPIFSGRLYAAAIYSKAATAQSAGQTTHVAIRQPFGN